MLVKEAGILRWSIGVRNRVEASLDVSRGVMQRIWGGYITYPEWFGTYPTGFGTGSTRRLTYPEGLCNVSGVVRRRSVGVRNRVDASLDVSKVVRDVSEGVMQRIRGGSEAIRWGSEPGRRVVGRIQRAYATYPMGFRGDPLGFGTGSMRRWTYPEGLYNVSDAPVSYFAEFPQPYFLAKRW